MKNLNLRAAAPAIILFNKPYNVLSQFTTEPGVDTLANYIDAPHYYPAGRLDKDSEGLLILTNNGKLQQRLSDPRFHLEKTYWVQVEGIPPSSAIQQLSRGVQLNDGLTRPARVRHIAMPTLPPRVPPIRMRINIPTSWLELKITEGRNRQVRRMTAQVGYPTLRLLRVSIGTWQLDQLQPGTWRFAKIEV